MPLSNHETKLLQKVSDEVSAPVLLSYVSWILHAAQNRGINKLYFLARDGYVLYKIALQIVAKEKLSIACKYLYCSRVSLRTPSYHIIGEEAYDLLLLGGYQVTPNSVLRRVKQPQAWCEQVLEEEGIPREERDALLSRRQMAELFNKLRRNETYRAGVMEASKQAYDTTVGYLKQEGLLSSDTVAIVDSGWTGSMQRSLRQILESMGYSGKLIGFYFGMYAQPKVPCDGEYLTWYFDHTGRTTDKILFCNNLFECILSAPHGMTLGYVEKGGYQPVFADDQNEQQLELINAQINAILQSVERKLPHFDFQHFDALKELQANRKCLHRFMANPTQDEVALYGRFDFSDDIREGGLLPLASAQQIDQLKGYSIFARILRRIRKVSAKNVELFWPYGVLAYLPKLKRAWYRWNIYIWEWIKCIKNRKRQNSIHSFSDEEYKQLIYPYDVISFDIFDTLLYRTVSKPTDVYTLMEPFARERCGVSYFHEKRIEAEQLARIRSQAEDVTLEEIYDAMQLPPEIEAILMDYEKMMELFVLRRDNRMAELLDYCVKIGKKVLIISDMYQDASFLKNALVQAGINNYAMLYVSSEEKVTKASGNLFRCIAEKERIEDKKKWIHFGDNAHSDSMVPKAIGLDAMLYDNGRVVPEISGNKLRKRIRRVLVRIKLCLSRNG